MAATAEYAKACEYDASDSEIESHHWQLFLNRVEML